MTTADGAPRLEVARVDRPHGLRGEVIVTLVTNRAERLAPGAVLQAGHRVLTVAESRPHQHRFMVRFEGVDSREAADALHGTALFAEAIDDPDEWWVHELIDAVVVDQHGTERGRVVEIESNPASDLLVLEGGALVPMRFVVSREPGMLHVDVPEGLFD